MKISQINICITGSAADVCKAAMLQVERALVENSHLDARYCNFLSAETIIYFLQWIALILLLLYN